MWIDTEQNKEMRDSARRAYAAAGAVPIPPAIAEWAKCPVCRRELEAFECFDCEDYAFGECAACTGNGAHVKCPQNCETVQ